MNIDLAIPKAVCAHDLPLALHPPKNGKGRITCIDWPLLAAHCGAQQPTVQDGEMGFSDFRPRDIEE